MGKEIIINAEKEQTRIAILEEGELVELFIENPENERTIGNIFLGRVRRIMPSIQAAFIDIGQKQDAFLHFSDLAENLPAWLEFLEQTEPSVEKVPLRSEHHRARPQRRRPKGSRHPHRAGPDEEASSPPDGEAEPEQKAHHAVADARTRSRRRSAQRRSRGRKDKNGAEKQETSTGRPAPPDEDTPRDRPLESYLRRDQRILVKISKEPISTKGSRVTTDISLAGRFLVLVPLADYVAVSKKIYSYKERRRLRALAKSLVPDGFGVIVRTVAEGRSAKDLDTDLRLLLEKWRKIEQKLAGKPNPPLVVHEDVNMVSSVIRDLFSEDYDRILIDNPRVYRNIKGYVQAVAPQMAPAVQHYKGRKPIFEATGIAGAVAEAFESRVNLPSGGYLFIEQTEAMHVIDVNSGRAGKGLTQEQNSLKVNLEAARAIARQVRLRDLGGIIVVDFIDMRDERNRRKVFDEMRKAFRRDRAVTKILPMSDFGLMQITRQRLRPSITTAFSGPNGTTDDEDTGGAEAPKPEAAVPAERNGMPVRAPEALVEEIERGIVAYKEQGRRGLLRLRVHPFTAAYLRRGLINCVGRWRMKHHVRVRLETDAALDPLGFRLFDAETGKEVT
ncbi:Rne/Rng family ribonuclease [Rhodocaloribacter litoris]|uniref:Rne/Rng family ribonuclease n=1 Tax=Rhodocaloribacter litoris TaxID=2558931 RepID=UPI0014213561|nr:Rne/Rng family ribonuclease [Rhodocaloribacter litoris]QXD16631.1 Rne/Rng family ribonuclease [Rhodocaloribacter litoris]